MNIPTEKTERQKLAQNLLKNAGLFCDEVPELLENWILYTSPYNSNELYFLPMLEKLKENPDFAANQKVEFFVCISTQHWHRLRTSQRKKVQGYCPWHPRSLYCESS